MEANIKLPLITKSICCSTRIQRRREVNGLQSASECVSMDIFLILLGSSSAKEPFYGDGNNQAQPLREHVVTTLRYYWKTD